MSLARWTAGELEDLGWEMMVTEELDRGLVSVRLHLDPDRAGDPLTELSQAPGAFPLDQTRHRAGRRTRR